MCLDCPHPAHARRCWKIVSAVQGRYTWECSCATCAVVAASAEGLEALLGGALERDSDLANDRAKDEGDGGLGVTELP